MQLFKYFAPDLQNQIVHRKRFFNFQNLGVKRRGGKFSGVVVFLVLYVENKSRKDNL